VRPAELITGAVGGCVRPVKPALAALVTADDEPATVALRPARAAHVIGLAGTVTTPTHCHMHHHNLTVSKVTWQGWNNGHRLLPENALNITRSAA